MGQRDRPRGFLREFRALWKSGSTPDLVEFVDRCCSELPDDSDWNEFLIEVLSIDMGFRWKTDGVTSDDPDGAGNSESRSRPARLTVNEYVRLLRPRELPPEVQRALLIEECQYRHEAGESPSVSYFKGRLQNLGADEDELAELDEYDSAVAENGLATVATKLILPQLTEYLITDRIGEGAMGVVYRATQIALKRPVALKILSSNDSGVIERFQAEARAGARLHHQNIVEIYNVGTEDGIHFISMALVDGTDLSDAIDGEKVMASKDAARLMIPVVRAIEYANQMGVVHRDLKPANILIAKDGTPLVADFGLAKQFSTESSDSNQMTQTGLIIGTPEYMSPEQARGDGRDANRLADVYSLGAVLYRLVTGRPPFKGAHVVDTLRLVVEEEPMPPRRLDGAVARDLETVILKCLSKSPRLRYVSAGALGNDLERFLNDEPIEARPAGRVELLLRAASRHKIETAAITLLLALLLVPSIQMWVATIRGRAATGAFELQEEIQTAFKKQERELELKNRVTQTRLYSTRMHVAVELMHSGKLAQANQLLDRIPNMTDNWDQMRGWEWEWLHAISSEPAKHVSMPQGPLYAMTSRGGESAPTVIAGPGQPVLFFARTSGTLALDSPVRLTDWDYGITAVCYSPDDRLLAISGFGGGIRVFATDSKEELGGQVDLLLAAQEGEVGGLPCRATSLAFTADGRRLVAGDSRGNVSQWEVQEEQSSGRPIASANGTLVATFRDAVAAISGEPSADVLVVSSGGEVRRISFDGKDDYSTLSLRPSASEATKRTYAADLSPDGGLLAIANSFGTEFLRIHDSLPVEQVEIPGFERPAFCMAWSSTGSLLAVGGHDGVIRFLDAVTLRQCGEIAAHQGPVLSMNPLDSGYLISAGSDGALCRWPLHSVRQATAFQISTSGQTFTDSKQTFTIQQGETTSILSVFRSSQNVAEVSLPDAIKCLAAVAFENRVAVSGIDGSLSIFDQVTGELLLTIVEDGPPLASLSWESDDRVLVARDKDSHEWRRGPTVAISVKPDDR